MGVPNMAQKADEFTETEDKRKSVSKRKFLLLTAFLTTIIILLCIIIIVLMTSNKSITNENSDKPINKNVLNNNTVYKTSEVQTQIPGSPYEMIYREKWGGSPPLYERPQIVPVKYVIISHTAGRDCFSTNDCSKQMQIIQRLHIDNGSPDIGYNFLVGGDENIYVGRGWENHNFHMNLNTIGISFVGNYMFSVLRPGMIGATQQLLKDGVEKGKLDKNYILVAHNQTSFTQSPGINVYKQIKLWPHFSPEFLKDIENSEN